MKGKKQGTWLMTGGLLLMAAALLLTCYNLWDERRAAASAEGVLGELPAEMRSAENAGTTETDEMGEIEIPDYLLNPEMEMPAVEIDGEGYIGTLKIPALDLELPVMEEWSYPRLRKAPCRYSGSAYRGDMVIAAHNYKTHFGRLKELRPGDEVTFIDADGNVFRYAVAETETLGGGDVEEMRAGDWDLTLFTCTYGGKSRVTVRCSLLPEKGI
ncbi:sortase [Dysosmobacter sp.]|uniref:sortase n=1 Tax=Dysosmobacter sp. TaxID=2591382 RepID=UPI002A8F7FD0|nr:sortase [Dysosmobacter sp.]MDY3984022.1 sortase [Dysosmobacter sp.]